jgi:hypothetical protein
VSLLLLNRITAASSADHTRSAWPAPAAASGAVDDEAADDADPGLKEGPRADAAARLVSRVAWAQRLPRPRPTAIFAPAGGGCGGDTAKLRGG